MIRKKLCAERLSKASSPETPTGHPQRGARAPDLARELQCGGWCCIVARLQPVGGWPQHVSARQRPLHRLHAAGIAAADDDAEVVPRLLQRVRIDGPTP